MPAGKCHLELHVEGRWVLAAEVRCDDVAGGVRSSTRLEYDFDYLADATELDARYLRAVSCRYPVGYGVHAEDVWPAFLLDVVPSGAARRYWEARLGVPNAPSSDWAVLVAGGGNPPGNVRVQEASAELEREQVDHPGSRPGVAWQSRSTPSGSTPARPSRGYASSAPPSGSCPR